MIEIELESEKLGPLKSEYIDRTTAALDGMWLCGFVPMAKHFSFRVASELIGYCCINDEGKLLQFYVRDDHISAASALMRRMVAGEYDQLPPITGAFVSTAEPSYLSYCLDNFQAFEVNTMMFHLNQPLSPNEDSRSDWTLRRVESTELLEAVAFVLRNLDCPEEWLNPYFSNLIQRNELFGCWIDGALVATGENRKSDDVQPGITDVGMIVDKQHRAKGLATWVLRTLVQQALESGLTPICSTEVGNLAAQKAIARAGFVSQNRIIQFDI